MEHVPKDGFLQIKASSPPFNLREGVENKEAIVHINSPVFGVKIAGAAFKLLQQVDYEKALGAKLAAFYRPVCKIDAFVQSKMKKVLDLCEKLPESNEKTAVMAFAKEFQELKDPGSLEAWHAWLVEKHKLPKGWEDKLHQDVVLSLFGFEKPKLEEPDIARWISKALSSYNCGLVTDFVNLLAAMHNVAPKTEEEVLQLLAMAKGAPPKWVPEILIIDLEKDDGHVLAYSLGTAHPHMLVLQVPDTDDYRALGSDIKKQLQEMYPKMQVDVFADKESRNKAALDAIFGFRV